MGLVTSDSGSSDASEWGFTQEKRASITLLNESGGAAVYSFGQFTGDANENINTPGTGFGHVRAGSARGGEALAIRCHHAQANVSRLGRSSLVAAGMEAGREEA